MIYISLIYKQLLTCSRSTSEYKQLIFMIRSVLNNVGIIQWANYVFSSIYRYNAKYLQFDWLKQRAYF